MLHHKKHPYKKSWFSRHKLFSFLMIALLAIILFTIGRILFVNWSNSNFQKNIASFYDIPSPLPSTNPGYLIRSEQMTNVIVPGGGTAYRILYVSQKPDNTPTVSSGIIYVPSTPAPAGGRKVVSWAHGTLGFGDNCTPSRNPAGPLNDTDNWLGEMMQQGWVVTATDYTGLGTPGDPYYLIGSSEAHDVINAVRAARNMPVASVGTAFAVWGHSQGGHSALFTAQLAKSYAPELKLVGAATAAPAAELGALFTQQYNQIISWGIGPDAALSWPQVYPGLPLNGILSAAAERNYKTMAYGCVQKELADIELHNTLGQQFFATNPMTNKAWYAATTEQTPNTKLSTVPIYVAQGLADVVVLPNTTALLVQNSCQAGVNITVNWMGGISHTQAATTSGPAVVGWLSDRFNNIPAVSNCSQPLPISPANAPMAQN